MAHTRTTLLLLLALVGLWAGYTFLRLGTPSNAERSIGTAASQLERARATTALAAVLEAASQVANADSLESFRNYGIARTADAPAVESAFPERRALTDAVSLWSESDKNAALAWVLENATWTTMLHALVLESFDGDLNPTEWGPTMSRGFPGIFDNRGGLTPLLRTALEDPAIAGLAVALADPGELFTPEAVIERKQKILDYLRLPDDLPPFEALFTPLLRPVNGVNVERPDGSILFVVGPSASPQDVSMVLSHEMAHQPVYRIVSQPRVLDALASSHCAFALVENNFGYPHWFSYFSEALVRALSYRLEEIRPTNGELLFESDLYEALESWEPTSENFEDAVVGMLADLQQRHCPTQAIATE